ncbi:IS982 family transposase, partial [Streptococcus anginosus]
VLADLGYLSQELKDTLEQKGYHLWTLLPQNMVGAEQHNYWQLLVMRRTIENRFSEPCALVDIEHTLTRSIMGLQLRME